MTKEHATLSRRQQHSTANAFGAVVFTPLASRSTRRASRRAGARLASQLAASDGDWRPVKVEALLAAVAGEGEPKRKAETSYRGALADFALRLRF